MENQISYINHRIRTELNLSLQEYCVAEAIANFNGFDVPVILEMLRITPNTLTEILNSLTQKKILIYPTYGLSHLWLRCFDYNENFNLLWSIHDKGNKKVALKRYLKICKKVDIELLKNRLTEYVASRPSSEYIYLKGLDVWLNPQAEHWNDKIVRSAGFDKKPVVEEKKISNFFQ